MDETIILSMRRHLGRLRRDLHQKVYAPLAECYRRSALLDDAEETAREGLNVFPGYLLCREVLGRIYLKQGKLEQAREQLERVAGIIKDNPELSRVLGKLYIRLGNKEEAKKHLEFVLEKDPFDFEVRNYLNQLDKGIEPDEKGEVDARPEPADEKIYDIEAIIRSMEEPEVRKRSDYAKATDDTLDSLEQFEEEIDAKADELAAQIEQDEPRPAAPPLQPRRPEVRREDVRGIHEAAVVGQLYMEIHLLDELLILAKRLLDQDPDDPDLELLRSKFERALTTKEAELDRLEEVSLATGP